MNTDTTPAPSAATAGSTRFTVTGTLKRKGKRKVEPAFFCIDADDIDDARFLAHHGVIEMTIARECPGAKVTYDLRTLKRYGSNRVLNEPSSDK